MDLVSEPKDNHGANDEVTVKDLYFKTRSWIWYLLSKWITIIGWLILGAIVGLLYSYFKKPVYKATTTFVLEEDKAGSGLGAISGLASIAGFDLGTGGGGIFQGDNILQLYKSRLMIEKTLLTQINVGDKSQLLIDRYIDFNNLRKKWEDNPKLQSINFRPKKQFDVSDRRLQDSILKDIVDEINKKNLNVVKPDKKLSIINVEVSAKDEFFAKIFNEQIVKNVNDFYVQTKTKKSLENVLILQQKTDSVRDVMNGAIYIAANIADATPNLNPTRQVQRIAPMQKSQFNAETNKSILGELVKNLEMSKISLRKETPLIQVVDKPILPLEVDKVGKLKGAAFGCFIFGFLSVLFLSIQLTFKNLLSGE